MPEQRRLVTILFADVTGSTALGESLDPEDVRALMGRYFAHARRVVSDHGGTLEKFIGDAVMAVFGLAHAWGDDAERALAAALALRDAITGDAVLARWLTLRMGVNTGEVVAADDISQGDFLITGDAVNIAARLEQHATPGEILASERTVAAARTVFSFGPTRQIEAKGKSLPLRVFPVLARQSQQARRLTSRPPLVGRRQDLLQLELLKARALEERQQQMVTIFAPAGVGKTRLVEEFLAQLDSTDGFCVATMRCQPYGQTLTFAPLHALLTGLLGGEPTEERVEEILLAGGQSSNDAACMADSIVQPLSRDHEVADRESVVYALRLLLEAQARAHPTIVVFEDLHWASDGLLDLIEPLMRPHAPAPLLLIALSRPELLDRRPAWGAGQRNTTLMTLQPLSDAQTRDLVSRLTEGMSETLRANIAARSAGNPFFAAELTRALTERQARGEVIADEALPDTVHAAVQARLDLLTADERALAEAASVVGQSFTIGLLQPLLPTWPHGAISDAVDSLLAHDVLALAGSGRFVFRHALIHEVAYGTLSRAGRMRLHAALGDWLDTQSVRDDSADKGGAADGAGSGDDSALELTAYHYMQAITLAHQSAVPLNTPLDVAHTVAALERAGVRAGRMGAFAEAVSYLRAAITIAPPAEHTRLYERLGDSGGWGNNAMTAYQQALDQWRASDARDPLTGARLIRKTLITVYRTNVASQPTPDQMAALRAEAQSLLAQADDADGANDSANDDANDGAADDERWHLRVADLFMAQVIANAADGQCNSVVTMADGMAAASHFEAKGDWQSFSEALDGCASYALHYGTMRDVLAVSQRRLTAPELPATERNDAIAMVARSYLALGEFDKSIAALWDGLENSNPGSSMTYLSDALATATLASWVSGRWEGLDRLHALLTSKYGMDDDAARSLLGMSFGSLQIALSREDTTSAEESFTSLERIIPRERLPNDYALLRLYRTGDLSQVAIDPYGIQLAGPTVWFVLMFLCERDLSIPADLIALARHGRSRWEIQSLDDVAAIAIALGANDTPALASAIDAVEASGLLPFAAHMRIVLAQRTGDLAPLARARPVLERLGDRLFLRRLEEVTASHEARK